MPGFDPDRYDDGMIPRDDGIADERREALLRSYKNQGYRGPIPGEQRDCKACGAPLVFARTREGKVMPISQHIKVGGNVLVFKAEDGLLECRVIPKGECLDVLREQTVGLRVSHFGECPRADEFRKQRIRSRDEAQPATA